MAEDVLPAAGFADKAALVLTHHDIIAAPDSGGNWQFESKRYQHWVKAGPDGAFTIRHVRPGTYTLYAFTAGATGEYKHSTPVTVTVCATFQLPLVKVRLVPVVLPVQPNTERSEPAS